VLRISVARVAVYAGDLERARECATTALADARAASPAMRWHVGNAIHHGNLVLGQVALREGDLATAERHLLQAGKTACSPQLNSFGPNMGLALELLKRGRKNAVVEYLNLCAVFWKRETTEAWIRQIDAGEIPDFGANLWY
jgi:hypothetical protein